MKRFRVTSATSIVLVMLCIMYFITYLDRVNVSTAAAGFGKEFGLSHTEVGLVFSAFAYPYLIFQIIGGWVSDRFGAKRTLIFCGAIWGVATLLTGLAGGLVSLLAARVLLGFGEGATFPAATSAMARWVAKEKRGFAQGITHAASRIGNAVAPGLIVLVMATWGWRESFYICGVFSLVWVAVWAFTFTEHPKDHPRITTEELEVLPAPKPKAASVPWGKLFRRMWPVTIVYFCYGWTLWLFLSWIPQYFLHSYHLQLQKSAIFASVVFFAGVIGDTLGGIVTDWIFARTGSLRRARSWMVSVCMLFCLLSLIPLMFTHSLYLSMACLAVRLLLCRNDDRSDVGDSDGHRAGILGHRERHDEHRLGIGRDHFAGGRRVSDRLLRQLGIAVRRQHAVDGDRRGARVPHAAGKQIRVQRGRQSARHQGRECISRLHRSPSSPLKQ